MGKIKIIILSLFPIACFGQLPQTGLSLWTESTGINWRDSTIVIGTADTAKIINNVDTVYYTYDSDNHIYIPHKRNYLDRKSPEQLILDFDRDGDRDTVPVVCIYPNFDLLHRTFFKIENQVLNSDSTELYPQRITAIAVYSAKQTGSNLSLIYTTYNLPDTCKVNCRKIGTGKTYTTIGTAITAASANDTLQVFSNVYDVGTGNITFNKSLRIQSVGDVSVNSTATTFIFLSANNISLNNFQVKGTGTQLLLQNLTQTGNSINNCYFNKSTDLAFCVNNNAVDGAVLPINNTVFLRSLYAIASKSRVQINQCFTSTPSFVQGNTDNISIESNYNRASCLNSVFVRNSTTTTSFTTVRSFGSNYTLGSEYLVRGYDLDSLISTKDKVITGTQSLVSLSNTDPSYGKFTIRDSYFRGEVISAFLGLINKSLDYRNSVMIGDSTGKLINVYALSDTVTAYIYNSYFENTEDGSPVSIGNSDFTYMNKVTGTMQGCKVIGPGSFASVSHGVCLWHNNNFDFKNNYVKDWLFSFVLKGLNTNYSNVDVVNNVWIDGRLIVKGVDSTKIYQNTGIIIDTVSTAIFNTAVEEGGNHSNGTKLYNNVFANVSTKANQSIYSIDEDETLESNNNVFWNPNGVFTSGTTFAQWQALGNDTASFNQNPRFKSVTQNKFWLTKKFAGANLGTNYDDVITINSVWPNSITTTQNTVWQIGAFEFINTQKRSFGIDKINGVSFGNFGIQ